MVLRHVLHHLNDIALTTTFFALNLIGLLQCRAGVEFYALCIKKTQMRGFHAPLTDILGRRYEGRVTLLALMSLGLIERIDGGWQMTDAGRFAFFT